MYLDAILADTPLVGGLEPRLGDLHVRTLTILGFPSLSRPGILDALNHQDFGYRWVTRFIALDKTLATKTLTSLRRQWFNKRKSVTALLREVLYNQPAQLLDSDADNKVVDADLALQALGGDHVAFGYLTTTITVTDRSRAAVEDKVRAVERIVNGLGFTCVREGSCGGGFCARRPPVSCKGPIHRFYDTIVEEFGARRETAHGSDGFEGQRGRDPV
jgi:type IV secretion system protein VirB4